jgi:hypothetical protein
VRVQRLQTAIRDIVDYFEFPTLYRRLPFTLLRRLVIQRLVFKIRPRLAYQPLKRSDADTLDKLIAHKIHAYLHFPFPFNPHLLSMPFSLHGFDFPSIARLNDSAAVTGLARDLNHHLPLFRDIATITLADWTCSVAHCHSPLNADSPSFIRNYTRLSHKLPSSWIVAQSVMQDLRLSIRDTDLSFLLSGRVALQHLVRLDNSPLAPPPQVLRNLASAGLTLLNHVGSWSSASATQPAQIFFQPRTDLGELLRFTSASQSLPALSQWLSSISLPTFTYGCPSLALPPATCQ